MNDLSTTPLFIDSFKVIFAKKNGHCLVQSFSQHLPYLEKNDVCTYLYEFLIINASLDKYTDWISRQSLRSGLLNYINLKHYDSDFCDVLPKILSDCFNVSLQITIMDRNNCPANSLTIYPDPSIPPLLSPVCLSASSSRDIFLLKTKEHYDALIPIYPPHNKFAAPNCDVCTLTIPDPESTPENPPTAHSPTQFFLLKLPHPNPPSQCMTLPIATLSSRAQVAACQ